MTANQLDQIGRLADKADNFYHAGSLMPGLSAEMHKNALTDGMLAIRDELRAIYTEDSGENPWND